MAPVSKDKLEQVVYEKLFKQFAQIISEVTPKSSRDFLMALLAPTEQIMLTKRLAAVVMLHEGYSRYAISKTLKLSSSTAARIAKSYENGHFEPVIKTFRRKKERRDKFWLTVEVLLRGGMPSMGKDRWKHLPGGK